MYILDLLSSVVGKKKHIFPNIGGGLNGDFHPMGIESVKDG